MAKITVSTADVRACLATLEAVAAIVREKPRPDLLQVIESKDEVKLGQEARRLLLRDLIVGPLGFTACDDDLAHDLRVERIEATDAGLDMYLNVGIAEESGPHRLRCVRAGGTWKIAVFQSQCAACFALEEFKPCMLCVDGWLPEQSDHELSVRG